MAEGSNLLISQMPASFAAIGEKHNNLVTLLRTMTGSGACKVTFSENRIIINVPNYSTTFNTGSVVATSVDATAFLGQNLTLSSGTYSISIPQASITQNLSLKEIDVCSGGVAKKMLVLASDPY